MPTPAGKLQRPTRNRLLPMKVFVTEVERTAIEKRAAAANLSISAFLRTAGLNKTIRSTVDHEAVGELAKLNGDQGRLGGLLKLWLTDQPGRGVPARDVRELLEEIEALQSRLAEIAARL